MISAFGTEWVEWQMHRFEQCQESAKTDKFQIPMESLMNRYIFITDNIHPIGGMQLYVAGKSKYLEDAGWKVTVFFPESGETTCAVKSLDKYSSGAIWGLWRPPFQWGKLLSRSVLNIMKSEIGVIGPNDRVVVESNTSSSAQWGELLASSIGARHVCMICNESFRDKGRTYQEVLPFFEFKLERGELKGIAPKAIPLLFDGYRQINPSDDLVFFAAEMSPVQDVPDQGIEKLEKTDWTICHIGRSEKKYVPLAIEGIARFCEKHKQIKVRVVFIGDTTVRDELIDRKLLGMGNVEICRLGNKVPIPRCLYSKIDVVIASSGCASYSAAEGVTTIVADAGDGMSNGILGIDTHDDAYRAEGGLREEFEQTLERVFADNIQCGPYHAFDNISDPDNAYKAQVDGLDLIQSKIDSYGCDMLFDPKSDIGTRLRCAYNCMRNAMRILK